MESHAMLSKDAQAMAEAIRDGDLQGLSAAQLKDLNLLTRPIIRRQLDGGAYRACSRWWTWLPAHDVRGVVHSLSSARLVRGDVRWRVREGCHCLSVDRGLM